MPGEPLPLFPLNTVLFPRMPLPLHVFEERYKQMINRCLQEETPFGIILIKEGEEVGGAAVPEGVGTIARIHAIERLDEGRLHLLTEGTERFRLLDYIADAEPYLVGLVEPLHDEQSDARKLAPLVSHVSQQFHEYFHTLVATAGVDMPDYELPEDPEEFSFVIAAVVRTDMRRRQALLEMTDTAARLRLQKKLLTVEIERIKQLSQSLPSSEVPLSAEWRKPFLSRN
jgi:Lon protease-like protein